ncbi:MAG: nucleotidyltransferase domain-containing protein [Ruminiclostridium sp.]|nr:nucleotidyltransferase domain-containing protein [Ruminiclostridium sp.]
MDQKQVLSLAKEYAAAVREVVDATAVFLYGSHAKGTATEDSDIDIAIVVKEISGDYLDTMSALWRLTRSVNQNIEPVLLTLEDETSGFLSTVRKTGIAV